MDANFQATWQDRIATLAQLSETPDYLTRPSFTPAMQAANQTIGKWMQMAGMTVREDAVSNLIGRYEGQTPDAKTLIIGSHLDTVRNAGHYDGILGVLLGLACVEELARQGQRLPFAIEVMAFCDEEGLRFHLPYIGSRAIVGQLAANDLNFADEQGITLAQALEAYGSDLTALAAVPRKSDDLLGYLEVHIEQGPVLEAGDLPVGIVSGIAGQNRLEVEFVGEAGHAGTVPMNMRRDALVAAAQFIVAVQAYARNTPGLVATVGQINALPGASNAVPGRVILSLDVRHLDDVIRETAVNALHEQAQSIASNERVESYWRQIAASPSVPCAPVLIEVLREAVKQRGIEPLLLSSGAGHDAVMLSQLTAVAMLFVRCRGGISHNPAEYTSPADAESAADVLLAALHLLAKNYP